MAIFSRTTKDLIIKIDEFFDDVEIGLLVFREGIDSYVKNDMESFARHLQKLEVLESKADRLQRSIENEMITHSILPQHREEVARLIDGIDEILDGAKKSLNEFEIERPDIPTELARDFLNLTGTSSSAAEELIPAARAYFITPHTVREKLIRVFYFEGETDKTASELKTKIFHNLTETKLDLARKAHLRYIIHHIESISDLAQEAADMLSLMAIRIVL